MEFESFIDNLKIAFVHRTPMPSEKANAFQTLEIARALHDEGIELEFYCPKAIKNCSNKKAVIEIEKFYGGRIPFKFKFSKPLNNENKFANIIRSFYLLKKVLKNRNNYSLFYTRQPYFLIALIIFKKAVIYEVHQWRFYKSRIKEKVLKFFILKAANRDNCKIFICISEELRKRWINFGIKSDKTITAHDAVNLNNFTPVISKEDARASLNLDEKSRIVSYVGSLYENRAILDIIWVAGKLPDVLFRIIGGPTQNKEALKRIVNEKGLKNVEIIGRINRSQIPLNLFSSDVLLFTMNENTITHDICSPMKVFEYLAAARAIVAPNLPSMREILTAEFCFLYEFPNKYSLRDKIIEALSLVSLDSNYEKQKIGRIIVQEKFTWKKRTKLILKKLMEIKN